jgi:hypothetical protein
VGRRVRTIPAALRRALRLRDQRCRFPGCHNHRFVDVHHLIHWADGGETTLENTCLLCPRHHTLLHEGAFQLERDATGELRFLDPRGQPLPMTFPTPEVPNFWADPGAPTAASNQPDGDWEPVDYDACIDALLGARLPGGPAAR